MSRYCRAFVIFAFYMADNNGLRTLPEKEYKKAVKFHVEFYSFFAYNKNNSNNMESMEGAERIWQIFYQCLI